jgi:hypothetical protein
VTQVGELVTASLIQEFAVACPFKETGSGPAKDGENIGDDDKDEVQAAQDNDGGVLGQNLSAGNPGVADGGPFPPTDFLLRQPANDSHRGRETRLYIPAYRDSKAGTFPFTVAAHHIIPGNASLYKSKLFDYMQDGGKLKSAKGKEYNIKGHIGYDVNGSHNGVWLPGNYAIKTALPERKKGDKLLPAREGTTPIAGKSWGALSHDHEEWQFAYVAGCCKAADGQFHDTHDKPYSESVSENLTKIVTALALHLDACKECSEKNEPIPPPFRVKRRLYSLSKRLRGFLTGPPGGWKESWFTSSRWSQKYFQGGKLTRDFYTAYTKAAETRPHVIPGDLLGD